MRIDQRAGRAARLWVVGVILTFAALAAMVAASFVVIGYLSPVLGRGVFFTLTVVGVVLGGLVGLTLRWYAKD